MKKFIVLILLTSVSGVYTMMPSEDLFKGDIEDQNILEQQSSVNYKTPISLSVPKKTQELPSKITVHELVEKEQFIQERKIYWTNHLKSIYHGMIRYKYIQDLIVKFSEADYERFSWDSSCEAQKKNNLSVKNLLHH